MILSNTFSGWWIMKLLEKHDIYKDNQEDVETIFDTSERPLPKGKNKQIIGLMKDELGDQILKEFVGFLIS